MRSPAGALLEARASATVHDHSAGYTPAGAGRLPLATPTVHSGPFIDDR